MTDSKRGWRRNLLLATAMLAALAAAGCDDGTKTKKHGGGGHVPVLAYAYTCGIACTAYKVDSTGKFGPSLGGFSAPLMGHVATTSNGKFVYAIDRNVGVNKIYSFKFTASTGLASATPGIFFDESIANQLANALAIDLSNKYLVVVNQVSINGPGGNITVFSINQNTGDLTLIGNLTDNALPAVSGTAGVTFDPTNRFFYLSIGSNIYLYSFDPTTGAIANTTPVIATAGSVAGMVITSDDTRLYAATDVDGKIHLYDIQSDHTLVAPGTSSQLLANPSALGIDRTGKYVYATIGATTNNVLSFKINPDGSLTAIGTPMSAVGYVAGPPPSTQPVAVTSMSIDPTGKYLYTASDVGSNGVDGFSIDASTGILSHIGSVGNGFPISNANTTDVVYLEQ